MRRMMSKILRIGSGTLYQRWAWLFLGWLLPLSWLHWGYWQMRRSEFNRRRGYYENKNGKENDRPRVIIIGNITLGGGGKTPLVLSLVQHLQEAGKQVGIVSRGYGGKLQEPTIVLAQMSPAICGDEVAWLVAQLPQVPVAVGRQRQAVVAMLHAAYPDLDYIISDDGWQHRDLCYDHVLVAVDELRGFGDGWLAPLGPLRSPLEWLAHADAVLYAGRDPQVMRLAGKKLQVYERHIGAPRPFTVAGKEDVAWDERGFGEQKIVVMVGIANPSGFLQAVRDLGVQVESEVIYADHYAYREDDFSFPESWVILTTEKDAIKIVPLCKQRVYYLPLQLKVKWAAIMHSLKD